MVKEMIHLPVDNILQALVVDLQAFWCNMGAVECKQDGIYGTNRHYGQISPQKVDRMDKKDPGGHYRHLPS